MIKINKASLKNHVTSKEGEVKSYRTLIDNLIPPSGKEIEFNDLLLKIKSTVVVEECLTSSIESFLALKKYYCEKSGYYSNFQSVEAHALFTQGALYYRSSFVRGNLIGSPVKNLNFTFENDQIHQLLRNYIDKKIAHVDENHEIKLRKIEVTLLVVENNLIIDHLSNSGEEIHSYHISTLEDIIEHISKFLETVVDLKSNTLEQIKNIFGKIEINQTINNQT